MQLDPELACSQRLQHGRPQHIKKVPAAADGTYTSSRCRPCKDAPQLRPVAGFCHSCACLTHTLMLPPLCIPKTPVATPIAPGCRPHDPARMWPSLACGCVTIQTPLLDSAFSLPSCSRHSLVCTLACDVCLKRKFLLVRGGDAGSAMDGAALGGASNSAPQNAKTPSGLA